MKIIALIFVVGIVMIGLIIGSFFIKRKVNYSLSYKSMVQQTIREMVKEEALR